jgi:hypothetical protein
MGMRVLLSGRGTRYVVTMQGAEMDHPLNVAAVNIAGYN